MYFNLKQFINISSVINNGFGNSFLLVDFGLLIKVWLILVILLALDLIEKFQEMIPKISKNPFL